MKLRNKNTGEVIEIGDWGVGIHSRDFQKFYNTIAEFNEEWEDYKPAKPLIKDEKIRKAVRAWADINNIKGCISYGGESWVGLCGDEERNCNKWKIELKSKYLEELKNRYYTITELCGEEYE